MSRVALLEMCIRDRSGSVGRLYNELSNFEPVVLKQWLLDFSSRLHDDMADALSLIHI